jgi:hypothetical protein
MLSRFQVRLTLIMATFSLNTFAFEATIYEKDTKLEKKIFSFETQEELKEGLQHITTIFKNPEGQEVIIEKSTLKEDKLVEFTIDQKQIEAKARVAVKDGKVFFEKNEKGKEKKNDEKYKEPLVISSNFQKYIANQLEDLIKGKTIEFRYVAWTRAETVGFEVFKESEESYNGEEVVVLKMKPSSFIISALVKPLQFKFSKSSKKLLYMKGRVAPMQKVGDIYKDLDAEVVYKY